MSCLGAVVVALALVSCSASSGHAPPSSDYRIRPLHDDLTLQPSPVEPKVSACKTLVGRPASSALDFDVPKGYEAALRCYTSTRPGNDSSTLNWLRCFSIDSPTAIYSWHGRRGIGDQNAYVAMESGVVHAIPKWATLTPNKLEASVVKASGCDE